MIVSFVKCEGSSEWPLEVKQEITRCAESLSTKWSNRQKENCHEAETNIKAAHYTENRYMGLALKAFAFSQHDQGVKVSCNERLFCMEADIVLRVGDKIVNVEIDGSSHRLPVKRWFCMHRDRYLTEHHGVRVVRWDLMSQTTRNMDGKAIIDVFCSIVHGIDTL